jgi:NTE family protein
VSRGLVLGGGGVAGIAWEIGLLARLAELGTDVRGADLVVGTSAGSVVGTLLRGDTPFEELWARQSAPVSAAEPAVQFDATAMMAEFAAALAGTAGEQDARARIGALALRAPTPPEEERKEVIAARIGDPAWPAARLVVTAVDTADGAFRAFDAASGVPLLDAVAASCAVPGVWPPVTIDGRRYMDGGMRSVTNADLATGCERVLVVAPMKGFPESPLGPDLDTEVATLRRDAEVHVVLADEAALRAFGTNPLSPASRRPSALAGRAQADAVAEEIAAFWR